MAKHRLRDDPHSLYIDIGLIYKVKIYHSTEGEGKQSDLKVSKRPEETSTKRGDMNDR